MPAASPRHPRERRHPTDAVLQGRLHLAAADKGVLRGYSRGHRGDDGTEGALPCEVPRDVDGHPHVGSRLEGDRVAGARQLSHPPGQPTHIGQRRGQSAAGTVVAVHRAVLFSTMNWASGPGADAPASANIEASVSGFTCTASSLTPSHPHQDPRTRGRASLLAIPGVGSRG